jgi:hypothetical protein
VDDKLQGMLFVVHSNKRQDLANQLNDSKHCRISTSNTEMRKIMFTAKPLKVTVYITSFDIAASVALKSVELNVPANFFEQYCPLLAVTVHNQLAGYINYR